MSDIDRRTVLTLAAVSAMLAPAPMTAADTPAPDPPATLSWRDLRPAAAEATEADDPFVRLSPDELNAFAELTRLRDGAHWLFGGAERRRAEALAERLRAQGLPVEALLARREANLRHRRAAHETPVGGLDGRRISLAGHLLPLPADGFLLVPWIGDCSHVPPPPANQTVRLRFRDGVAADAPRGIVQVSGTLRVRAREQTVFLVDGRMVVRSAYAIDDAVVTRPAGGDD